MLERRKNFRSRTFLGGSIAFNGRNSTVDCLVRNLSPEGAKVSLQNTVAIPHEFDLTINQRESTIRARMIWRRAEEAGLAFCDAAAGATAAPADLGHRLRKAEADRAKLRRRVAELGG